MTEFDPLEKHDERIEGIDIKEVFEDEWMREMMGGKPEGSTRDSIGLLRYGHPSDKITR